MPRDVRAYLADIIEACRAIQDATADSDLDAYKQNRLLRSAVEREFIIIGEALNALSRVAADTFETITHARRVVDFRNKLTHEYPSVDSALVWAIVETDVPLLHKQSDGLLARLNADHEEG